MHCRLERGLFSLSGSNFNNLDLRSKKLDRITNRNTLLLIGKMGYLFENLNNFQKLGSFTNYYFALSITKMGLLLEFKQPQILNPKSSKR